MPKPGCHPDQSLVLYPIYSGQAAPQPKPTLMETHIFNSGVWVTKLLMEHLRPSIDSRLLEDMPTERECHSPKPEHAADCSERKVDSLARFQNLAYL